MAIQRSRLTHVEFYGLVELVKKHQARVEKAKSYDEVRKIIAADMQKEVTAGQVETACKTCGVNPINKTTRKGTGPLGVAYDKIEALEEEVAQLKTVVFSLSRRLDKVTTDLGMIELEKVNVAK